MRRLFFFASLGLAFVLPSFASAATFSWPASQGTTISSTLMSTATPSGRPFEPSDLIVIDGGLLVVSDEGDVATMDADGGNVRMWLTSVGNDIEGATLVGNTLYLMNERNRDVQAYDFTTHALLRTYDLSDWIAGSDNEGPEGFVYHDGQWLVGHSATEEVYAFDLSGDAASFLGSWNSAAHVRAMHSGEDGYLYIMTSGRVALFEGTTQVVDYTLPVGAVGPEGFALDMNCASGTATAFIGYDSGSVARFENFPVSCAVTPAPEPTPVPEPTPEPEPVVIDADADGVPAESDCNDADATVSSLMMYYRDADSDTLGSATDTTSVCSSTAPAGYVTNTSDTNDSQAYFSATGTINGSIIVTYGDGSSATYQVYAIKTSTAISTVYQYKGSDYLVVYAPFNKRVAVVDAYTGAVVAMRWMPRKTSQLDAWLVSIIGY